MQGCITGAVCGWVTNPLDVVKTRLMLGDDGGRTAVTTAGGVARVHSLGVVGQFRQLIRTGGVVRYPWPYLNAFVSLYIPS